jgi:hypothetical protein
MTRSFFGRILAAAGAALAIPKVALASSHAKIIHLDPGDSVTWERPFVDALHRGSIGAVPSMARLGMKMIPASGEGAWVVKFKKRQLAEIDGVMMVRYSIRLAGPVPYDLASEIEKSTALRKPYFTIIPNDGITESTPLTYVFATYGLMAPLDQERELLAAIGCGDMQFVVEGQRYPTLRAS